MSYQALLPGELASIGSCFFTRLIFRGRKDVEKERQMLLLPRDCWGSSLNKEAVLRAPGDQGFSK